MHVSQTARPESSSFHITQKLKYQDQLARDHKRKRESKVLTGPPHVAADGVKFVTTSSTDLPIAAFRGIICESVKNFATTVLCGETGSGKSTQLSQFLQDDASSSRDKNSRFSVVCTQPRRVAAITIAQRVAFERGVTVGEEVGYSVRFDDKTSPRTSIKYVTDGVLLRECMSDPTLSKYNVVILDESHERSLQTDILMGLLKSLQLKRPSLRLVIMSATLEVDLFMNFFSNCNYIHIPGRQFPVNIYYTREPEEDFTDAALITCLQIHAEEEDGGILVFLPGQEDIENLVNMLHENLPCIKAKKLLQSNQKQQLEQGFRDFAVFPLYAALSQDEQLKAFNASIPGVRKIVVATNIAETSLTIAGITYVVDTGFNKTRSLNATGMETLRVMPVSQSQANQRSGRAGRECPGKCFRLYCEEAFEKLSLSTVPEICRTSITQVILQLKQIGVHSPETFPFPSLPSVVSIHRAINILGALGALDKSQVLTPHGLKISKLPLDPVLAHMLLRSIDFGCVKEAVTAVAMLSTDNIFLQPHREDDKQLAAMAHKRFATKDGDLPTLVSIYDNWQKANRDKNWSRNQYLSQRSLQHAAEVSKQLAGLLSSMNIDPLISCQNEKPKFLKCVAAGLFLNVAQRTSTSVFVKGGRNLESSLRNKDTDAPYKTLVGGAAVHVHPSSVMFSIAGGERKLPEFVCYAELLVTSKQYMRCITAIEEKWLVEIAPNFYKNKAST